MSEKSISINELSTNISITTPESYEAAAHFLKGVKELMVKIKDTFGPLKKKASEAHKLVVKEESDQLAPLQSVEAQCKGKMSAYLMEEEEKRKALQARLEAEAKRYQEEMRLREAVSLETSGDSEGAMAVLDAPDHTPPPLVVSNVPKVLGVSEREVWGFEVFDADLLPRTYLIVNVVAIRGVVLSLKGQTNIPGVRVFSEKKMTVRK
mgnify:CR=1 FL=1